MILLTKNISIASSLKLYTILWLLYFIKYYILWYISSIKKAGIFQPAFFYSASFKLLYISSEKIPSTFLFISSLLSNKLNQ